MKKEMTVTELTKGRAWIRDLVFDVRQARYTRVCFYIYLCVCVCVLYAPNNAKFKITKAFIK